MADVDVTSPGVWARESDVAYEELLRREDEEGSAGTMPEEVDIERPRARGGRLTEQNLKLWLSLVRGLPFVVLPIYSNSYSYHALSLCGSTHL